MSLAGRAERVFMLRVLVLLAMEPRDVVECGGDDEDGAILRY